MANSIDRENVIKVYENFVNGYECFCTSDDIEYEMHKAVLALLKEQEAHRWRLCSDELPETEDEVLTTYIVNGNPKKRFVETASYFNDGDGYGHWNSIWNEYRIRGTKTEVIAWMPLPKPYKEGQ